MQQVQDTSTHINLLLVPSFEKPHPKDSGHVGVEVNLERRLDSIRIQKKATISYALVQAEKEREDSLLKVEEAHRLDSIDTLISHFDQQLNNSYSIASLPIDNYYKGEEKSDSHPAALGIVIICLLLMALLWSKYRKRLSLLIKCISNWKMGKQVIRYEQVYSHPVNYVLLTVFVVALSLFGLFAFFPFLLQKYELSMLFSFSVLSFAVLYFLKIISLIMIGKVFEIKEATREYIFHTLLLLKCCGVILVPVIILFFYSNLSSDLVIAMGTAVILLSFFIRVYRGFLIGLQLHERLLAIILYLCTLEILPALFIVKFLKDLYFS